MKMKRVMDFQQANCYQYVPWSSFFMMEQVRRLQQSRANHQAKVPSSGEHFNSKQVLSLPYPWVSISTSN